ncbi:MAG: hypothetical protein V4547_09600 [Bacteroidota bacterium]
MDKQPKRYRLLKDLPDAMAGTILTWDENYGGYVYADKVGSYDGCLMFARNVEINPDWFEEVLPEHTQERIEVKVLPYGGNGMSAYVSNGTKFPK